MEYLVMGIVLVLVVLVFFAAIGCTKNTRDRGARSIGEASTRRTSRRVDGAGYAEDEGWIPLATSPTGGYASLSQGGRLVGSVEVRHLHLPPGWQAGPRGMRPFTKKAREDYEERQGRRGQP